MPNGFVCPACLMKRVDSCRRFAWRCPARFAEHFARDISFLGFRSPASGSRLQAASAVDPGRGRQWERFSMVEIPKSPTWKRRTGKRNGPPPPATGIPSRLRSETPVETAKPTEYPAHRFEQEKSFDSPERSEPSQAGRMCASGSSLECSVPAPSYDSDD